MKGAIRDVCERRHFKETFKAAGVDCLDQNAGEKSNDIEVLLRHLARFSAVIYAMPQTLGRAVCAENV